LLFGALRDAGPDSWGRRVIEKHAGVAKFGELDYLLESPDDRAGALGSSFRIQLALWSPDVSSHAAHPASPLAPAYCVLDRGQTALTDTISTTVWFRPKQINGLSHLVSHRVKLASCCVCWNSFLSLRSSFFALAATCCSKIWRFDNCLQSGSEGVRSRDLLLPTDCSGSCCAGCVADGSGL